MLMTSFKAFGHQKVTKSSEPGFSGFFRAGLVPWQSELNVTDPLVAGHDSKGASGPVALVNRRAYAEQKSRLQHFLLDKSLDKIDKRRNPCCRL
jgi:hypothetical protein